MEENLYYLIQTVEISKTKKWKKIIKTPAEVECTHSVYFKSVLKQHRENKPLVNDVCPLNCSCNVRIYGYIPWSLGWKETFIICTVEKLYEINYFLPYLKSAASGARARRNNSVKVGSVLRKFGNVKTHLEGKD